jgi:riboflavin biosynthesis pyrimidine reductase
MRIIWSTAMSMDGKLAAAGHDLAFLDTIGKEAEEASEFPRFLETIDAVLLGAETLRWLLRGGHGWPHGDKPTWLLSHDPSLAERVGRTAKPFRRVEGDVQVALAELEASGAQRVWLSGGGNLAGQLLTLDRIDDVEVTIAPVALGAGFSLFGDRPLDLRRFRVVECRAIAGRAVVIRWTRARERDGESG